MRIALSIVLIAHGVAHLVGFVVPWRLMAVPEMPYGTTILAGAIDIGDSGARALGALWLIAAVAFAVLGGALLAGVSVRGWLFALLGLSLALCALGWPEARIGVAVNAVLLGVLLLMPQLATVAP
jgi:hypothetical protein